MKKKPEPGQQTLNVFLGISSSEESVEEEAYADDGSGNEKAGEVRWTGVRSRGSFVKSQNKSFDVENDLRTLVEDPIFKKELTPDLLKYEFDPDDYAQNDENLIPENFALT